MAGGRKAPRDPRTGRYISLEALLRDAQAWYAENDKAKKPPASARKLATKKDRPGGKVVAPPVGAPGAGTPTNNAPDLKAVSPSEFAKELAAKSVAAPAIVDEAVEAIPPKVVASAKKNVKKTAPLHSSGAERYIDSENIPGKYGPEYVVGYDTRGAGRLGILLEFGGGGDHSPPHWDLRLALDAHEDEWFDAIGDAGEQTLENGFGRRGLKYGKNKPMWLRTVT